MPKKPDGYVLGPATYKSLQELIRWWKGQRGSGQRIRGGGESGRRGAYHPRLAKVITADITGGSTGSAQLQKADWTDSASDPITVQNDYTIAMVVGTKLLVMPVQGAWRIITVYNLECPEA